MGKFRAFFTILATSITYSICAAEQAPSKNQVAVATESNVAQDQDLVAAGPRATGDRSVGERDNEALRQWINARRQVTVKELGGALSITGDVHTEMQSTSETRNGIRQRGHGGATHLPQYNYDIEANLILDYRATNSWSVIKFKFDNDAGIVGGTSNKVKLDRAYFGYRFFEKRTTYADVEMGRKRLNLIFDSKIEFDSMFDGVRFKIDHASEKIGDAYGVIGAFLIRESQNRFGYAGELGLQNIANTKFYTKYSLIDWDTKKNPTDEQLHFIVSQLMIGYKWIPKIHLKKFIDIYSAVLTNSAAQKLAITRHKRANWGGYAGVSIGEIRKQGDWSLDANYQIVAAQAIPDFDVSGIGLGNAAQNGFYHSRSGKDNDYKTAEGNVNYRGYNITLQYLLTNNLNLFQSYAQTVTLNDKIGPFRKYYNYEIDFIYLW